MTRFDAKKKVASTARGAKKAGQKTAEKLSKKPTMESIIALCKSTGKLWEDPDFPATSASVYKSEKSKGYRQFEWKRPSEITANPAMFSDGASRFDIEQGALGDCWLLAVLSSLTLYQEMLDNVVPPGQSFKHNYTGAFRFRFWRFGKWKEIIVDDRLPTKGGKLVYMHSRDTNEFWSALLEKAYAKMSKTYEGLTGGSQAEAMEDFTGGLCETLKLTPKSQIFDDMVKFQKKCSLMGCAIESKQIEGKRPDGLITGHAYSVTDIEKVDTKSGSVNLVRIRNPWGNEYEWNGDWSDKSPKWSSVSASRKKELELSKKDDGEFWMCHDDFVSTFTKLEVCHLGPDSMDGDGIKGKIRWEMSMIDSEWNAANAGGCRNFLKSFATNPQFRVSLEDSPDDDDDTCTLIIGLMQKDKRQSRLASTPFEVIGYSVYKVTDPTDTKPLGKSYFEYKKMVTKSPNFSNTREQCGRHHLPPGEYVIIPSTFQPKKEGKFLLRIFSEGGAATKPMDEENSYTPIDMSKYLVEGEQLDKAKVKLQEKFNMLISKNKIRAMNATQLRTILNVHFARSDSKSIKNFSGFSKETCRAMIALFDFDRTGGMEFDEFFQLYMRLIVWRGLYLEVDIDGNGLMDSLEFRELLSKLGFTLINDVYEMIVKRLVDADHGAIEFEDFILCAVRLTNSFEQFNVESKQGNIQLDEINFLKTIIYS